MNVMTIVAIVEYAGIHQGYVSPRRAQLASIRSFTRRSTAITRLRLGTFAANAIRLGSVPNCYRGRRRKSLLPVDDLHRSTAYGSDMSWEDAHRYNQALRDIRADLDVVPDIALVWRPEYRQIFGSPEQLVLALRSRWNTMLQAQVEEAVTEDGEPTATVRALAAATRPRRSWERHEDGADDLCPVGGRLGDPVRAARVGDPALCAAR
jgi:hypothetical protein